jgi:hypothetical protein
MYAAARGIAGVGGTGVPVVAGERRARQARIGAVAQLVAIAEIPIGARRSRRLELGVAPHLLVAELERAWVEGREADEWNVGMTIPAYVAVLMSIAHEAVLTCRELGLGRVHASELRVARVAGARIAVVAIRRRRGIAA